MFSCIKLRRPVTSPGWAGADADKAIRGTQARVNAAAQAIIAASPAEHTGGAKPPGTDLAIAKIRRHEGEAATADLDPGLKSEALMADSHDSSDVA